MRSRFTHSAIVCSLLTASVGAVCSGAQPAVAAAPSVETPQRTVLDYFRLLPWLGIGYPATRQNAQELLRPENNPVIDLRHNYLRVKPDSSPAEQIAVFRSKGKPDLLAVSLPDYERDYNTFVLYRLQNGKLRDVTDQTLPIAPQTGRYLYELPQFGTTIRVFKFSLETHSRRHVFDLQWRGGRFIKVQ